MTYQEIFSTIENFGLPAAYWAFPKEKKPALPYICYYFLGDDDLQADNINYQPIRPLNVDLYTAQKDIDLETRFEKHLNANNISYSKETEYIDSEQVFLSTYSFSAVITE